MRVGAPGYQGGGISIAKWEQPQPQWTHRLDRDGCSRPVPQAGVLLGSFRQPVTALSPSDFDLQNTSNRPKKLISAQKGYRTAFRTLLRGVQTNMGGPTPYPAFENPQSTKPWGGRGGLCNTKQQTAQTILSRKAIRWRKGSWGLLRTIVQTTENGGPQATPRVPLIPPVPALYPNTPSTVYP